VSLGHPHQILYDGAGELLPSAFVDLAAVPAGWSLPSDQDEPWDSMETLPLLSSGRGGGAADVPVMPP